MSAVPNWDVEQLAPSNIPVYGSTEEGRALWERCVERAVPVVAVRDARRGFIIRYDFTPVDCTLSPRAVAELRTRVRRYRQGGVPDIHAHPQSETVALGGEVGPVAGNLHEHTEKRARRLASRVRLSYSTRATDSSSQATNTVEFFGRLPSRSLWAVSV